MITQRKERVEMKKIWYALRYGDTRTKRLIISVAILFVAAAVSLVMLLLGGSSLWWLGTAFSLLLAIIIMQSVSFHGTGKRVEKKSKKDSNVKAEKTQPEEEEPGELKTAADMTQEEIEQILVAYKVKKNHIPIMIDSWPSQRIRQCPAYLWTDKNELLILTLEEKPRKAAIPLRDIKAVYYEPGVTARPAVDYPEFQKPSFAGITFGGLVPTYYEEAGTRKGTQKNLYRIGDELTVTNTSIRPVIERLKLDIQMEDPVMSSERVSPYYKEGYKLSILWKDGVIRTKEYKSGVKQMMQSLTEAELSMEAFLEYVNQLVRGHLITQEYAEYYIGLRKKIEQR